MLCTAAVKRPWSQEERDAVSRHLSGIMMRGILPRKEEIERCIGQEQVLQSRSWRNVKDYCRCKMKK